MAIPYPSIDSGFIYDPGKKLDCLLSDFFECEYSQSYLFYGSITSLPWILQQYQDDEDVTINQIRTRLQPYLFKYFDDVVVKISLDNTTSSTTYSIFLSITVKQDSETVNLYNRLNIVNSKLTDSINIRK